MRCVVLLICILSVLSVASAVPSIPTQCVNDRCNYKVTVVKTDDPATHRVLEVNINGKEASMLIDGANKYLITAAHQVYAFAHGDHIECTPQDPAGFEAMNKAFLLSVLRPQLFEFVGEDYFAGVPANRFYMMKAGITVYADKSTGKVLGGETMAPSMSWTFFVTDIAPGNTPNAFSLPKECANVHEEARPRNGGIRYHTHEELLAMGVEYYTYDEEELMALPRAVDWTRGKTKLAEPVLDQGMCGSCWSHAAVGALYGQIAKIKGAGFNPKYMPSRQFFMDCAPSDIGAGCQGGDAISVYQWVAGSIYNIPTELAYPYRETDHHCMVDQVPEKFSYPSMFVTGAKVIPEGDEKAVQHALATVGPLAIAICDNLSGFKTGDDYVAKTTEKCTADNLAHAVLLVGYGVDELTGEEYWTIQNSWSDRWRDSGYIRVARNRGDQYGIAMQAGFPVIDASSMPNFE